jgi:hypothetical protein
MEDAAMPDRRVEQLAYLCGVSAWVPARHDWAAVEGSLAGLRLPADYKELVQSFPDGWFRDLVRPIRPGDVGSPATEYLGFYANWLEDMRTWRSHGDGEYPYPIYPESGGLLPWAEGHGGEMCFWLTGPEDPDTWPVVSADKDFERWQLFPGPMCGFLTALVHGSIDNPFQPGSPIPTSVPAFSSLEEEPPPTAAVPIPPATSAPSWGARQPYDESAELSKVIPADLPVPATTDWPALHRRLGITLPADYRSFVDTLGTGVFCDLRVLGADPCGEFDLPTALRRHTQRAAASPQGRNVPFHPQPAGIIPWGETTDGWVCAWRFVDRDPGEWPVLMIAPDYNLIFHDELSFSSFLLKYCGERDQLGVFFARQPWGGGPTFVPHPHG